MKKFAAAIFTSSLLFPVLASGTPACRMVFLISHSVDAWAAMKEREPIYIPPVQAGDAEGLRKRLDLSLNTGAATVAAKRPLAPEIAAKLHSFLVKEPYREHSKDLDLLGKHLLADFSTAEIDQIREGLERHFDSIKTIILNTDGKAIQNYSLFVRTEKDYSPTWEGLHSHGGVNPVLVSGYVTATHAILGPGTLYETIHNGELEKAYTKAGETLILSEGRRYAALFQGAACSVCAMPHPVVWAPVHGAPSNISSKRLILIAAFKEEE